MNRRAGIGLALTKISVPVEFFEIRPLLGPPRAHHREAGSINRRGITLVQETDELRRRRIGVLASQGDQMQGAAQL